MLLHQGWYGLILSFWARVFKLFTPIWNKKKIIFLLQITATCKFLFYIYRVGPQEGVILC
ncbi:hypothetical protein B7989_02475 [Fibrobacter sp. UWB5]|nr:hypothetical protein B7989_02475 [Fibrobacter sp. UWB5]